MCITAFKNNAIFCNRSPRNKSYGVICYQKKGNSLEFLVIKHRISIPFREICSGRYSLNTSNDLEYLKLLVKNLLVQEQEALLTRNFRELIDIAIGCEREIAVEKVDAIVAKFEKLQRGWSFLSSKKKEVTEWTRFNKHVEKVTKDIERLKVEAVSPASPASPSPESPPSPPSPPSSPSPSAPVAPAAAAPAAAAAAQAAQVAQVAHKQRLVQPDIKWTWKKLIEENPATKHQVLWFPKGGAFRYEIPLQCALREFEEETTLSVENISKMLRKEFSETRLGIDGKTPYHYSYFIGCIERERGLIPAPPICGPNNACNLDGEKALNVEVDKYMWVPLETLLQVVDTDRQKMLQSIARLISQDVLNQPQFSRYIMHSPQLLALVSVTVQQFLILKENRAFLDDPLMLTDETPRFHPDRFRRRNRRSTKTLPVCRSVPSEKHNQPKEDSRVKNR